MAEERNLFGMIDEISANQAEILGEITGVKTHVSDTDVKIAALEQEISKLKNQPTVQPRPVNAVPQKSDQEILQTFLKQSKKSWRWFGTNAEFNKCRNLAIISSIILLIVGLAASIVSTICFEMYSTFTFFENVWMVFGVFYLIYALKATPIYEVNDLASNSSTKYNIDKLGMRFPKKEKVVFRIFKWFAIISVVCNIICVWAGMGKNNQVFATIMEVLFLAAIIFAFFMNLNLFAQYSIIWVEGHNLTTKERVVLVLPPGAKELMPEEVFKKKMPIFYQ